MTITKMTRSAHGLSNGDDNGWWYRAARTTNPGLFVDGGEHGPGRAIHICLRHCPVLAQCKADTRASTPVGVVQAGVRWTGTARHYRSGPTSVQPTDTGHGPWCRTLRRSGR